MGTYFTDVRESLGRQHAMRGGCACPACGGLECMCRPRFHAGQLLTEEELNQLEKEFHRERKKAEIDKEHRGREAPAPSARRR
jgi:hypothetical protein